MKKYQVKITNKALDDMQEIYNYISINLQSPNVALKQYNRIANSIESLDDLPERIKLMDSEPEHSLGFRHLLIDNYSVFFIINHDIVYIVRVLYSASDISARLLEEIK